MVGGTGLLSEQKGCVMVDQLLKTRRLKC